MRSKRLIMVTFPLLVLVAVYFVGSTPNKPIYDKRIPAVPAEPALLDDFVFHNEQKHKVKPDNQARIVWADSSRRKTEYAVVYLHGFSASQKEGDPVHLRFAKTFGCNLYLSRLSDHGVDTTEQLLYFTADRLWNSAKEALAIGNQLGEKVILISTSTGGTVALMLAANYPDRVHALINLSPNIAINDPAAFLLNNPWGLQIARAVLGGNYRNTGADSVKSRYWNNNYRIESIVQLEELVETGMTSETFEKITHPSLTLYYYKDEEHQDPEVKVSAMIEMHNELATPDSLKIHKAIPTAGAHVIGGSLASKDVEAVYREMENFAVTTLKMVKNEYVALDKE
jgi:pimeloyl-ACP methyl ester carboxylesterase